MNPVGRARSGLPRFTGVTTYLDPQGRFEFRHPSDWPRADLDDGRDGVLVSPADADDETYFAVEVTDLAAVGAGETGSGETDTESGDAGADVRVVAEDLEVLRQGFDEGIARLPGVLVEESRDNTYNDIVQIEREFTFEQDGERRRRRVWAMYADHWQFLVVYQGSTPEEFDYWLPMGNYCFTAFTLPMELWFATDPSVAPVVPAPADVADMPWNT